jgi:predicted GIY-YIG superfamily endonuclease
MHRGAGRPGGHLETGRRLSGRLRYHEEDAHRLMSPGDIVSHEDYPQWGRGYVIRAGKTGSVVFFLWGGKRRVEAGEPLTPRPPRGVEAEFFAVCASLSAQSWSRGRHSVYAIELDPGVWKHRAFRARNPGGAEGGCLYIGVTGLTPEARFARHQMGTQSGRFVRTHGVRLRLDLVEGFARLPYPIATRMEPKLAAWLRAQGFAVWQN